MARWDLPGVPHKGWILVGFEDIKEKPDAEYETCEMCGNERIVNRKPSTIKPINCERTKDNDDAGMATC